MPVAFSMFLVSIKMTLTYKLLHQNSSQTLRTVDVKKKIIKNN